GAIDRECACAGAVARALVGVGVAVIGAAEKPARWHRYHVAGGHGAGARGCGEEQPAAQQRTDWHCMTPTMRLRSRGAAEIAHPDSALVARCARIDQTARPRPSTWGPSGSAPARPGWPARTGGLRCVGAPAP